MKHTAVLKILYNTVFPVNRMVIHPNTGFDLGFMQIKYVSKLYINSSIEDFKSDCAEYFCDADIMLLNECQADIVEISKKLWEKLGRPEKALLIYNEDDNKMFFAAG